MGCKQMSDQSVASGCLGYMCRKTRHIFKPTILFLFDIALLSLPMILPLLRCVAIFKLIPAVHIILGLTLKISSSSSHPAAYS
ncbi:hypothetical protein BJX63DRAFT_409696 [Aspergillus granulosus]|uniref:Uncharacterized protein n=1 Tax=Aspergillus granulosus TaxID=176169 RepID=A0ABR4GYU0_9EURO